MIHIIHYQLVNHFRISKAEEMKDLLLRHYIAIKQRGLISSDTSLDQFMDKLEEEYIELRSEYANYFDEQRNPDGDFIHEAIDVVMVILNMLQHYDVDFIDELKHNVKYQESRINIDFKPEIIE